MTYRLSYDLDSGAGYIRLREGEYAETIPLTPDLSIGLDVDADGLVLGLEYLSFKEYVEFLTRSGGYFELPERLGKVERGNLRAVG